jgi:iron complex outermembrane receptor protein
MAYFSKHYGRILLSGTAMAVMVASHGSAMAQGKAAPQSDSASTAADIVVTGSRLVTNGNSSPTPLTVASAETLLTAQPASIAEGLNSLPGLIGSINPTSNANTGGFNMLNLRGIGSNRGLILVDGRRVGPTQAGAAGGTVDIDVIPQILLKHVDVVTGGASAAYGSDAVSGVVNFVTDTHFTGLKANARAGISRYGDDKKYGFGAAWGTVFADGRAHFIIGYEYSKSDGFKRSDRPFLTPWQSMVGSGTTASPFQLIYNGRLNSATFGGLINSGPLAGLQFGSGGTLSAFNAGTPTLSGSVNTGGDGAYYQGSSAGAGQEIHRATTRFEYELSDNLTAHAGAIFATFDQTYTQKNPFFNKISMGYSNPYLSSVQSAYQSIIAAQPAGSSFTFSKLDLTMSPDDYRMKTDYYNIDIGLDGKLGAFKWDVNFYRARTSQTMFNYGAINAAKFYAAIDAVNSGGNIVCNASLTNANYKSCVPLNLFGSASEQKDAINYVTQTVSNTGIYATNDFNGAIRGPLFELPAGPVSVALMGEYRKLSYSLTSNATPTDVMDCSGIQFNCVNSPNSARYFGGGQAGGGQTAARSKVSQIVIEQAVELQVPLLADSVIAKSLSLNLAGRHAYYDTTGVAWTWKAGAVWDVANWLTLRGTLSRDIRAPNLIDLFSPKSLALNPYTDLHTNTSGTATVINVGNPNLTPEKADTVTFGVVFKPSFLPGLSAAVDYYRINIHNAIASLGGNSPAVAQACENSGGTAAVCALFQRPLPFSNTTSANFPTAIYNQSLNVASLETHGIDFELNYATRISGHRLSTRALVTYQPTLRYDNGPAGVVDVGGAADGVGGLPPTPKWKLVASANYDVTDKINVNIQERWRDSLRQNGSATLVFAVGDIPSVAYTDINVEWKATSVVSAYLNVQNLFDKKPPAFASTGGSTQMNYLGGFPQGDDIEGRYFTVGVRARM